ncbi:hypothetical protein SAMN04488009_1039 [Maribacter sedimenticola]|uniref:Polysaccharide lyase n=1 Tax=Maribacter sedimenticola TaxID=228956 RepID=A0ABY1SF15_9FLAO|nr:hypothetical protein [Maribacter sedimenticola]SNR30178.1 hypothetical protein SAMN04488009_1039 [Maribacter sedimenticola]
MKSLQKLTYLPLMIPVILLLLCACGKDDIGSTSIVETETEAETETEVEIDVDQNGTPPPTAPGREANLLFKSGFEGVSLTETMYDYQYIVGKDTETGYYWPPTILGSANASEPSGIHNINDDNGAAIDNALEVVTGPNGNETTTLFQRVNYDVQVTQAPYQINDIQENPDELYIAYWMKTDASSVQGIDKWRAIWEYKTANYASYSNGFRMIAFMATDIRGNPYWMLQGDVSPQNPIWQVRNTQIPLILGEWFKVEYHIKWSNGDDGYASMKVNGQLIGEHHGVTTYNNDNLDFIMLTQVYGSNYPMYQWVDDVEIWDGVPE